MFQTLAGILGKTEPEHSFSQLVHDHLSLILKEFVRYFPTTKDPRTGKGWIYDPFVNKLGKYSMSVQEDQLLEIANDCGLKTAFKTTTLLVFWNKVMAEYPEIATTALKSSLPFLTTYLCEAEFSAVTATKTKQRNKLDISNTLRASLSWITPRWNRLIAKKQAQGSKSVENNKGLCSDSALDHAEIERILKLGENESSSMVDNDEASLHDKLVYSFVAENLMTHPDNIMTDDCDDDDDVQRTNPDTVQEPTIADISPEERMRAAFVAAGKTELGELSSNF
ncbi:SCAN domain-containing protein 3 [Trichonephila clavipes]|nr:SCAN domain-containing protein 3 [Trichonephila clavipes]